VSIAVRECEWGWDNAPPRGQFLNLLARKCRAREADLVDVHVAGQCRSNLSIARHDVDHTGREPGFLDQSAEL
jgi:hypothetical protein